MSAKFGGFGQKFNVILNSNLVFFFPFYKTNKKTWCFGKIHLPYHSIFLGLRVISELWGMLPPAHWPGGQLFLSGLFENCHFNFILRIMLKSTFSKRPFGKSFPQAQQLYCSQSSVGRSVGVSSRNHNKVSHGFSTTRRYRYKRIWQVQITNMRAQEHAICQGTENFLQVKFQVKLGFTLWRHNWLAERQPSWQGLSLHIR